MVRELRSHEPKQTNKSRRKGKKKVDDGAGRGGRVRETKKKNFWRMQMRGAGS